MSFRASELMPSRLSPRGGRSCSGRGLVLMIFNVILIVILSYGVVELYLYSDFGVHQSRNKIDTYIAQSRANRPVISEESLQKALSSFNMPQSGGDNPTTMGGVRGAVTSRSSPLTDGDAGAPGNGQCLARTYSSSEIKKDRLSQYCNKEPPEGSEGRKFVGHNEWALRYVLATIRHGDRSAIHTMPNSDYARIPIPASTVTNTADGKSERVVSERGMLAESALNFVPRASSYRLNIVDGPSTRDRDGGKHASHRRLERADPKLNPFIDSKANIATPDHPLQVHSSSTADPSNHRQLKGKPPAATAGGAGAGSVIGPQENGQASELGEQILNPYKMFTTPDLQLSQGQLTTTGFIQHINLGKLLHKAYRELVRTVNNADEIYVRATNYARTIQSVTALLIALLPHVGGPLAKEQVRINVYRSEADEVMHGIGLRSSSHSIPSSSGAAGAAGGGLESKKSKTSKSKAAYSPGMLMLDAAGAALAAAAALAAEEEFSGGCDAAVMFSHAQRQAFVAAEEVEDRMGELFGTEAKMKSVTELADTSLPRMCHRVALPCSTLKSSHSHTTSSSPRHHLHPRSRSRSLFTEERDSGVERGSERLHYNPETGHDTYPAAIEGSSSSSIGSSGSGGGSGSSSSGSVDGGGENLHDNVLFGEQEAEVVASEEVEEDVREEIERIEDARERREASGEARDVNRETGVLDRRRQLVDSQEQCMKQDDLESLMLEADRFYCERYTGSSGGKIGTNLSIYPFMMEIMSHLNEAASRQLTKEKMAIFSGHDTVIAPVLAALGVYQHKDLCKWPPYASRIVFELWERVTQTTESAAAEALAIELAEAKAVAEGKHLATGNSASAYTSLDDRGMQLYVRVLFNGLDVTDCIPACVEEQRAEEEKRERNKKMQAAALRPAVKKVDTSRTSTYTSSSSSPPSSAVHSGAQPASAVEMVAAKHDIKLDFELTPEQEAQFAAFDAVLLPKTKTTSPGAGATDAITRALLAGEVDQEWLGKDLKEDQDLQHESEHRRAQVFAGRIKPKSLFDSDKESFRGASGEDGSKDGEEEGGALGEPPKCTLKALNKQIEHLLGPYSDLSQACKAKFRL